MFIKYEAMEQTAFNTISLFFLDHQHNFIESKYRITEVIFDTVTEDRKNKEIIPKIGSVAKAKIRKSEETCDSFHIDHKYIQYL